MSAGDCSICNAFDDDIDYRDGICECCYLEQEGLLTMDEESN